MTRRDLLRLAAPAALAYSKDTPPDITLRIAESNIEIAPNHFIRTLTYNNQVPGPLLRATENREIAAEIVNESRDPEMVHWHGLHIPADVDGAHEEGTPMVQARDRRVYRFTPRPAGTRWYHAHAMAAHNLKKGAYTGQFGMFIVEPAANPARYDREIPLILHEWEPYFSAEMAMDVEYRAFSINGKMLGHGEPVRVQRGKRVLFRLLNASATMPHRLSLPGHTLQVVALDGNPVPAQRAVPIIELAPGERADALVEMNNPGIWIFGEENDRQRAAGAGIVVEYAGAKGVPRWLPPTPFPWDYTTFANPTTNPSPKHRIPVLIEPRTDGNLWAINGKSYPNTDPLIAVPGQTNRLVFDNRSDMAHPVHLHRHTFEIAGTGVRKDVVTVPARQTVEVDFLADNPGPSLFHCHHQFHMDFGFMALVRY